MPLSDAFYGQILFIVGIIIPLVIVCCLRWICKTKQGRTSPSSTPQARVQHGPTYQEVEGLPRSLSYYDPPNGDPPPTYESIQRIPETQTLTYIDEHGNSKQVKWDGGAAIPTESLGRYNPVFQIGEEIMTEDSSVEELTRDYPEDNDELGQGQEPSTQQTQESSLEISREENRDVQEGYSDGYGTLGIDVAQDTMHGDTNIGDVQIQTSHEMNNSGHESTVGQTPSIEAVEDRVGSSVEGPDVGMDIDQVT